MSDLQHAREEIQAVDEEIAKLFVRRMDASKEVADYKRTHGLPIHDAEQEARVIERNSAYVEDPILKDYYVQFLKNTMTVSKSYQHRLIDGMRVAYSGIRGAFAHIAAQRIFPNSVTVSYPSFDAAYNAVVSCACDCAVLPIENSYQGEVGQVMELMFQGDLFINGVYDLPISQNLLGVPGAHISDIETVISHPQALGQCEKYIRQHGWMQIDAGNTAIAAQHVAEMNDIHTACIASMETAELYGLEMLDHDINESRTNTTRFAVFSRMENTAVGNREKSSFLLLFTVNNVAGALAKAINVIGDYGFNMKVLRSRPLKSIPWEHFFYVEAEGDELSENGQKMLEELKKQCPTVKTIGRYSTARISL